MATLDRKQCKAVLRIVTTAAAGLALLAQLAGSPARAADSVGKQIIPGHMLPAFAQAPLVGKLPGDAVMYLAIGLPLTSQALLDSEIAELYDPKSPHFHQFLTPKQFAQQFAASEGDYQSLIDFVRAHGLTVTETFPDRLLLAVSGSAAAVNAALHINLTTRRRSDGSVFFAPDREPSIDLDAKILHISGLDDYVPPKPSGTNTGSAPGGSFAPTDLRNAYVPGSTLTGEGQSVGLFELDGYYDSDVTKYEAKFPSEFKKNVPVSVAAALDGFVATASQSGPPQGGCYPQSPLPANTPPAGTPFGSEPVLDIDMVIAMAPGLDNVFVYEGCNGDHILKKMATQEINGVLPAQFSASWPIPIDATAVGIYKQMQAQGQSFLWAVGDGHDTCPTDDGDGQTIRPTMPDVTSVGGTILQMTGNGTTWQSETAAADGGGLLDGYPMPSYQAGIPTRVSNPHHWRMAPDVAADGVNVFLYWKGSDLFVGGTSVSAPLWAGFVALINQKRALGLGAIGYLNPALYAIAADPAEYANDFHDITQGSSPAPPKKQCPNGVSYSAGVGYDLVTGLGSPTANLINDLSPSVPTTGSASPCFSGLGEDELWCARLRECLPLTLYEKVCTLQRPP